MSLFSNKALGFLALLIAFLFACEKRRASEKRLSAARETKSAANSQKKATEEEIRYFIPRGRYSIHIEDLSIYDEWDSKWYVYPGDIEENMNVADQKGNVVDIKNILKLVTTEIDDEPLFESKTNIEGYKVIEEAYGPGYAAKAYCSKLYPKLSLKNLIFDDNLVVRLYDKNNKIISENKMINDYIYPIADFQKDPSSVQHKIKPYGTTHAELIGALELPPKGQREGLRYRALRVDERGNPRPYLWHRGKPYEYHLWEDTLDPYSEYKNWDYYEKGGCYVIESTYRRGTDLIIEKINAR